MGKKGDSEDEAVANHISGQSNKPISKPAHALPYDEVARELGADIQNGLSQEEHARRLEEFGRNEFGETQGVQPVRIFIGQIANSLTLVSFHLRFNCTLQFLQFVLFFFLFLFNFFGFWLLLLGRTQLTLVWRVKIGAPHLVGLPLLLLEFRLKKQFMVFRRDGQQPCFQA